MRRYFRPVPCTTGRFALAGGWARFDQVELLQRGAAPRLMPADEIPPEALDLLRRPRPNWGGLTLDQPRIMGIVNATPDSFSDGGSYEPVTQGWRLMQDGADLLDIGGESTRPGAQTVSIPEEITRVTPVIKALSGTVPISADTRKAEVALAAAEAGAVIINDVSGLDFDPQMAGAIAGTGLSLCLMHAQGVPETMQNDPRYGDVVLDVYDALAERIARAEAAGISRTQICVDPGIGFGKTVAHNLALLGRISLFHGLGVPILLGASRKSFIGHVAEEPETDQRLPGSLAVTLAAMAQGVQIHRVHDVAEHVQACALWRAVTPKTIPEIRS